MKTLLIAGLFLTVVHICNGQTTTILPSSDGNSLANAISLNRRVQNSLDFSPTEAAMAMYLNGYFAGFLDSSREWRRDSTIEFRFPPGDQHPTVGQLSAVVEKYLADHPEQLHEPAHVLVFRAIKENFPTPDYKKPHKKVNEITTRLGNDIIKED